MKVKNKIRKKVRWVTTDGVEVKRFRVAEAHQIEIELMGDITETINEVILSCLPDPVGNLAFKINSILKREGVFNALCEDEAE